MKKLLRTSGLILILALLGAPVASASTSDWLSEPEDQDWFLTYWEHAEGIQDEMAVTLAMVEKWNNPEWDGEIQEIRQQMFFSNIGGAFIYLANRELEFSINETPEESLLREAGLSIAFVDGEKFYGLSQAGTIRTLLVYDYCEEFEQFIAYSPSGGIWYVTYESLIETSVNHYIF